MQDGHHREIAPQASFATDTSTHSEQVLLASLGEGQTAGSPARDAAEYEKQEPEYAQGTRLVVIMATLCITTLLTGLDLVRVIA